MFLKNGRAIHFFLNTCLQQTVTGSTPVCYQDKGDLYKVMPLSKLLIHVKRKKKKKQQQQQRVGWGGCFPVEIFLPDHSSR